MIRYTIIFSALLAFGVILYGAYGLYTYRTSVQEAENNIESSEIHFTPSHVTVPDTSPSQQ